MNKDIQSIYQLLARKNAGISAQNDQDLIQATSRGQTLSPETLAPETLAPETLAPERLR